MTSMEEDAQVALEIQVNIATKVLESRSENNKYIKILLWIANFLLYFSCIITLCLSFPEIIAECLKTETSCDFSAPYAGDPLCFWDESEGDCSAQYSLKDYVYQKYHTDSAQCSYVTVTAIPDYGCDCHALSVCSDKVSYSEEYGDGLTRSECEMVTCMTYCDDLCNNDKLSWFLLAIVYEFFGNITYFGAVYFDRIKENSFCKYKCIRVTLKVTSLLSGWLINLALYDERLNAVFGWVAFGGFLFWTVIIHGMWWCLRDSSNDDKSCCNLLESMSKAWVPTFAFIFVVCGWIIPNLLMWSLPLIAFKVAFDFDFKVKLAIGLHTIALFLLQIVIVARDLLQYFAF
eukprot:73001_1